MADRVDGNKEGQVLTPNIDGIQVIYNEKDKRNVDLKALPSKPETYDWMSPKELKEYLYRNEEGIREARRETADRVEELTEKSRFDSLTGLENRRSFDEGILSAVNRANRVGSKIFLVMIDVDFFKKINDTYGHLAGDYVLKEFGRLLKADNLLRKSEKPFRYGGEEFAILVDGDPKDLDAHERVIKLCERIREKVEQYGFVFNGTRIPVTISLGVADFDQFKVDKEVAKDMKAEQKVRLDADGVCKLVDLADHALFAAKGKNGNGGRNRTVLADEKMDPVYSQYLVGQAAARG